MLRHKLRKALEAGDFEAAQPLVIACGESVRAELAAAASAEERQAIFDDAQETLKNYLYLVLVVRSHIHLQLQSVSAEVQYQSFGTDSHCWRMEG
jgi:hypothetical protein